MDKKTKFILSLLLISVLMVIGVEADAQCAMCKLSAETNMKNGGTEARGLNAGILYLLSLPYLLLMTFLFIWWKKKKNHSQGG